MNESPYGFNVNEGTSLDVINSYIGNYATPELAAADTLEHAPQGYDYLVDQYQRLSGDTFGNPFEAASSARTSQITDAITLGKMGLAPQIGTSTGQFGTTVARPSLLDTLRFSGTPQPTGPVGDALGAVGGAAPSRAGLLGGVAAKAGGGGTTGLLSGGGLVQQTLQEAIGEATLSHPEYRLPGDASAENFSDIQEARAAALGATDLFKKLTDSQSKTPVSLVNPELQKDEKGRPIAGDVLNARLFNDPEFQNAMKYQPKKAKALYKALFDRDLETDLSAQRGANLDRETLRVKTLAGLADKLTRDEITGEPMIRTYRKNESGEQIEGPPRKLSEPEQRWMEQSGGFESVYGYEPSKGADVGAASEKMSVALRQVMRKLKDEQYPNDSNAQLLLRAKNMIATGKPTLATPNEPPMPSWTFRAADFYGPALKLMGPYAAGKPTFQGAPFTQEEADRATKGGGGGLLEFMSRQIYGGGEGGL